MPYTRDTSYQIPCASHPSLPRDSQSLSDIVLFDVEPCTHRLASADNGLWRPCSPSTYLGYLWVDCQCIFCLTANRGFFISSERLILMSWSSPDSLESGPSGLGFSHRLYDLSPTQLTFLLSTPTVFNFSAAHTPALPFVGTNLRQSSELFEKRLYSISAERPF